MCEIFSIIGASIAAAVSTSATVAGVGGAIAGASAAGLTAGAAAAGAAGIGLGAATAIGVGATGLALGGLAAAVAIPANNAKREAQAQADSAKANALSALNNPVQAAVDNVSKTASTIKDPVAEKRTLSSLRIPTKQASSVGVNTSDTGTGLNIPT